MGRIHCKGQSLRTKRKKKILKDKIKTRMERIFAAINKALRGKE